MTHQCLPNTQWRTVDFFQLGDTQRALPSPAGQRPVLSWSLWDRALQASGPRATNDQLPERGAEGKLSRVRGGQEMLAGEFLEVDR